MIIINIFVCKSSDYFPNYRKIDRNLHLIYILCANMPIFNDREYHLFSYYGAEDAERMIILMGSATDAAREAIDYLNANGQKVGMISVHLYRPFSVKHLLAAVPKTVKKIAVLDRTGCLLRCSGSSCHRRWPLRSWFSRYHSCSDHQRVQQPRYARAQEPLHHRYRR